MTAATLTLTDFLLARIAEDEAVVVCCHGPGCANQDFEFSPGLTDCNELNVGPKRWVAECEAKRSAIDAAWDDHVRIEGEWGIGQSREQMNAKGDVPDVIAHLAAVYADHPDYRDEWRI